MTEATTLESMTIRARTAYVIGVAERVFRDGAAAREEGYEAALMALDRAWRWIGGASMSGYDLYVLLDSGDDSGLLIWSQEAIEEVEPEEQPSKTATWHTLLNALAYVCWRAYELEGAKYVPETIEAVSDSTIEEIKETAGSSQHFDAEFANRLKEYLLARYPAASGEELGPPVSREEIAALK